MDSIVILPYLSQVSPGPDLDDDAVDEVEVRSSVVVDTDLR